MNSKYSLITIIGTIFLIIGVAFPQIEYSEYDALLQKYVEGNSVDYSELMKDKEVLFKFTASLSEVSPKSHPEKFRRFGRRLVVHRKIGTRGDPEPDHPKLRRGRLFP